MHLVSAEQNFEWRLWVATREFCCLMSAQQGMHIHVVISYRRGFVGQILAVKYPVMYNVFPVTC